MGMLQIRGYSDFLQEPVSAEYCCELGVENLDGDLAVVFPVVGEIDGRHTTAAELTLDGVGTERALNLFEAISHSECRRSRARCELARPRVLLYPLPRGRHLHGEFVELRIHPRIDPARKSEHQRGEGPLERIRRALPLGLE